MGSDLHVTLVSLILSRDERPPELRLHYSSRRHYVRLSPLNEGSPSVDVLRDQCIAVHKREYADYATLVLIWNTMSCLHSLSLCYNFDNGKDNDRDLHQYINGSDYDDDGESFMDYDDDSGSYEDYEFSD
jgi:hypothetical protein